MRFYALFCFCFLMQKYSLARLHTTNCAFQSVNRRLQSVEKPPFQLKSDYFCIQHVAKSLKSVSCISVYDREVRLKARLYG